MRDEFDDGEGEARGLYRVTPCYNLPLGTVGGAGMVRQLELELEKVFRRHHDASGWTFTASGFQWLMGVREKLAKHQGRGAQHWSALDDTIAQPMLYSIGFIIGLRGPAHNESKLLLDEVFALFQELAYLSRLQDPNVIIEMRPILEIRRDTILYRLERLDPEITQNWAWQGIVEDTGYEPIATRNTAKISTLT